MWCVKLLKHLTETWAGISRDGIHLASMRVYDADPRTGKQRMVLLVPSPLWDVDDTAATRQRGRSRSGPGRRTTSTSWRC